MYGHVWAGRWEREGNVFTNSQKGNSFFTDSHTINQLLTSPTYWDKTKSSLLVWKLEEKKYQSSGAVPPFAGYVCIYIYILIYISSLPWWGSQAAVPTLGSRGQMFPLLPGWYYPGNNIMFMQTAFDIIALKQLKIELCLQAKHLDHRLCQIPLLQ